MSLSSDADEELSMHAELFCVYDASGVQLGFIREAAPLFSSPSVGGDSAALRAVSHTLPNSWNQVECRTAHAHSTVPTSHSIVLILMMWYLIQLWV